MKKTFFVFSFFIISILGITHTCFADPLWYGNIVSISGDTATLEFRGLEQKYDLSCIISTRECSQIQTIPVNVTTPHSTLVQKNTFRFPTLSTHRNASSDSIFKFYTTLSPSNKRTLSLVNTKTRKTYSLDRV